MFKKQPLVIFLVFGGSLLQGLVFTFCAFAGNEPVMRVLVKESKSLKLRADGDIPMTVFSRSSGEQKVKNISFRKKSGYIEANIRSRSRKGSMWKRNSVIFISTNDPRGIWLDNRRYGGELRVTLNGNLFRVVNHLGVESYLASVIGSEMPKTWPIEALKAQAVAARTYALKRYRSKGNFDIKADTFSQVYLGKESETHTTKLAANSTKTLVLTYKGKLINAVFHSSSGGQTESSGHVWKKQLQYLKSVKDYDDQNPKRKWELWFTPRELRTIFRNLGNIQSIEILRKSPTGRVKEVAFVGTLGRLKFSGDEIRKKLGLKSSLVSFDLLPYPPIIHKDGTYQLSEISSKEQLETKLSTSSSDINRQLRSPKYLIDIPPLPPVIPPPPVAPAKSSFSGQGPYLYIRGRGAGHGVGMSQWGAKGLAQQGLGFRKILRHFYRGTRITGFKKI